MLRKDVQGDAWALAWGRRQIERLRDLDDDPRDEQFISRSYRLQGRSITIRITGEFEYLRSRRIAKAPVPEPGDCEMVPVLTMDFLSGMGHVWDREPANIRLHGYGSVPAIHDSNELLSIEFEVPVVDGGDIWSLGGDAQLVLMPDLSLPYNQVTARPNDDETAWRVRVQISYYWPTGTDMQVQVLMNSCEISKR